VCDGVRIRRTDGQAILQPWPNLCFSLGVMPDGGKTVLRMGGEELFDTRIRR
jgi:hypothetical protein